MRVNSVRQLGKGAKETSIYPYKYKLLACAKIDIYVAICMYLRMLYTHEYSNKTLQLVWHISIDNYAGMYAGFCVLKIVYLLQD